MLMDQVPQGIQNQPQIDATKVDTANAYHKQSTIWSRFIPRTNKIFLILSLLFVFGLDLIILIGSSFSLLVFWIEMLLAFGVFLFFFYIENNIFSKKFAATKTPLDLLICVAIVIRNIVIFLNFIPFIQLLGMVISMYAGIPYVVIYALFIWLRYDRS